jgi:hypothetical protein
MPVNSTTYRYSLAEAENRPKSAHRYNVAEQQLIYKSEIERIWKAQFDSLSRKDEPQLTAEDESKAAKDVKPQPPVRRDNFPYFSAPPGIPVPFMSSSPAFSRGSSPDRDREASLGPENSRRVLRIKRLVG